MIAVINPAEMLFDLSIVAIVLISAWFCLYWIMSRDDY